MTKFAADDHPRPPDRRRLRADGLGADADLRRHERDQRRARRVPDPRRVPDVLDLDRDRARPARSRSRSRRPRCSASAGCSTAARSVRIRAAPASASVLLTFALALVLEGVMGLVWGNTSHAVRPPYFNQSFTVGELFLPEGAGLRLPRGDRRARRAVDVPDAHVDRAGDPRERREPAGRAARRRQRRRGGGADVRDRRRDDGRRRLDRRRALSVPARLALPVDLAPARDHRARRAWAACPARSSARCSSASASR